MFPAAAGQDDGVRGDLEELLATARVFALPMVHRFRGVTVREGVLLRGPAGWAEFAPFRDYTDAQCVPWLRAAVESATTPWPAPVRDQVPVNVIVPVIDAARAADLVAASGCRTAKVKVADPGTEPATDLARVRAVRAALGPGGRIRIDANGAWTVDQAVAAVAELDDAAGGLEYVEQPCPTLAELAAVRGRIRPAIAADESIRRVDDPHAVRLTDAADIAIVKVAPLGGVRAALRLARAAGVPAVVSSAVDSAVGLAAGVALAAALPELHHACGLGTGVLLAADVCAAPPRPVGGFLTSGSRAPDPDRIDQVAADPAGTTYWLDRLRRVARLTGNGTFGSGRSGGPRPGSSNDRDTFCRDRADPRGLLGPAAQRSVRSSGGDRRR
jgi:O-succinylbenzoate synthase